MKFVICLKGSFYMPFVIDEGADRYEILKSATDTNYIFIRKLQTLVIKMMSLACQI